MSFTPTSILAGAHAHLRCHFIDLKDGKLYSDPVIDPGLKPVSDYKYDALTTRPTELRFTAPHGLVLLTRLVTRYT